MYLSTSTSTEDFPKMYLSTFQVLYKLYLSIDVLKYKVLLPGSASHIYVRTWLWSHKPHIRTYLAMEPQATYTYVLGYGAASHIYLRTWLWSHKPHIRTYLAMEPQATYKYILGYGAASHISFNNHDTEHLNNKLLYQLFFINISLHLKCK